MSDSQPRHVTTDEEVLLLVKRIGVDKDWQVAPYPRMGRERTEKLAKWLREALPGCPMETRIVTL